MNREDIEQVVRTELANYTIEVHVLDAVDERLIETLRYKHAPSVDNTLYVPAVGRYVRVVEVGQAPNEKGMRASYFVKVNL